MKKDDIKDGLIVIGLFAVIAGVILVVGEAAMTIIEALEKISIKIITP